MFENVFKLLKIKNKILYIFYTRGPTTHFLGLNLKDFCYTMRTEPNSHYPNITQPARLIK